MEKIKYIKMLLINIFKIINLYINLCMQNPEPQNYIRMLQAG